MASVNKVIIIGNLGADPEVRTTGAGQTVATLRIATSERWQDKSGQKSERTEWHRVIVWGKQAELCKEYLAKGRQVYIEGRLQTRDWNDKEGNKRYTTEIVAQRIQFLGSAAGRPSRGDDAGDSIPQSTGDTSMPGFAIDNNDVAAAGDDIPF